MKNELVTQSDYSPRELIELAISGGADLDKLEKLLTLLERNEAYKAKKAYHVAMAEFKASPPKIEKDKLVSFDTSKGKTSYSHATLANITAKINQELSKYGLSASWRIKQNGAVSVTCKITHILGHSEETTLTAPADTSGSKNCIQAIGSTVTYLERYSLLALTGLATYDQDNDANDINIEYISSEEKEKIIEKLKFLKTSEEKLLSYLKIDSLDTLPKADYKKAMQAILARIKAKENKNANS